MKKTAYTLVLAAIALPLLSCGHQIGLRHFAGPIQPAAEQQSAELSIGDDRSITYTQGRLEVNLRPLTDEILNRQLAAHSPDKSSFYLNPYEMELNPYTYSDWNPPEHSWAPSAAKNPPASSCFRPYTETYPPLWWRSKIWPCASTSATNPWKP